MKKVLACIIAVLLLVSMMPVVHAEDATVYVSVSVDGKLEVAAQPLTVSDLCVDSILREAHKKFYSGGAEGYASGIDEAWNMFMINTAWGVAATPYVIINEATLAAGADVSYAKAGDNIILVTSSDPSVVPQVVSMTAKSDGENTTISALSWVLDFTTFTYKSSPVVGVEVTDGNGSTLGVTDATGSLNFAACPVAVINGLAAIPADGSSSATKLNAGAPEPGQPAGPDPEPAQPVAPPTGDVVYISVSVDGKLEVVAQPVGVSGSATVNDVLKMAHEQYYSDGADGYASGIDPTWNMFMISKAWGIEATPYVIINGMPIGADPTNPAAADTLTVVPGDNIILSTSSNPMSAARAVSMATAVDGGNVTVSALEWVLNFTSFTYSSNPLANANVVDAAGNTLGVTDAAGNLTIPVTAVAAIDGLAAIPADGRSNSTATNPPLQDPGDYVGIPEGEGVTVHITVSVGGKLEVAGQKVTVPKDAPTIENVIKEAHKKWYPTGEGGFAAGIDPTWNMYMISKVWGVATTPYVLYNGTPLGADVSVPTSANTGKVVDGDQITVVIISMGQNIPVISMAKNGDNLLVKEWTLDTTTFTYDSKSYSNTDIIDAATGEVLGKTDGTGKMKMPTCESGVIAVPGLSAFAVRSDVQEFTPAETVFIPPALDYSLFGGKDGRNLLIILVFGLAMSIPMAVIIFIGGRKEIKNKGVKHFKKTW